MQLPTVIVIGKPVWAEDVQQALRDRYHVHQINQPGTYMNTLIESRAALILVDGTLDDWARWTTSPKTSSATRRIPIILISDNAEQRATATLKGADLAITIADLRRGTLRLVQDYARVLSPQLIEQLDCECQEPLPERAQEGVRRFNAGEYYKQHDLFEAEWVETAGPVRDLYRAVLQVGVAYYQIERGNFRGALKMLQRSVQWLVVLPEVCQGIDVAQLREDSFKVRAELERLGEDQFSEFDHTLIQGVRLVSSDTSASSD